MLGPPPAHGRLALDVSFITAGSVYTEMNAVAKGVSLGIIDQSKNKEIEPISGGQQPYVDLMGRR